MALFRKEVEGDFLWGIWKVEEDIDSLLSGFTTTRERLEVALSQFTTGNQKKEWLAVRVLLRELCGVEQWIDYHPNGKPYLADESFHISVSHTKGYVAVALHPEQEVGIDIEKTGDKVCRVKSKFLQPEEEGNIPLDNQTTYLLLNWSAKETIYKLLGREDVELRAHIRVLPFTLYTTDGEFETMEMITGNLNRYLVKYLVYPDFVLTYAWNR